MSYTNAETVRWFAQVSYPQLDFENESDYDSFLNDVVIPAASRLVDRWCDHNFQSNAGTLVYDGSGKEILFLSKSGLVNGAPAELMPLPLLTVTAVSIGGNAKTIIDFKIYQKYIAYEDNKFDSGRQNVQIVGTWGYATVPNDVAQITAEICGNFLADMVRRKRMPDALTPILEAGGNIAPLFSHPNILSKNVKQGLAKYKFKQMGGTAKP